MPIATEIEIGEMRIADLVAVAAIERSVFPDPWSLAAFGSEFRNPQAGRLVARDAGPGRVQGYTVYWQGGIEAQLNNVAVAAGSHRRGVGRRLVEEVLRRTRAAGARELWLEVRPSNVAARALYQRLGFRELGRRRGYYASNGEDAITLRRLLEPEEAG